MKTWTRSLAIVAVSLVFLCNAISAAAAPKTASTSTATNVTTSGKKRTPPPPTPAPAPVATVHFCSNDLYGAPFCDPINNAFDLNTTRDLTILVEWQNVTGPHVQQVLFVMPNGSSYQAMNTAFDTSTGQGLQAGSGVPTVSNVLPVSGTWIQQRAIKGAWTVQVYLDNVLVSESTLNLF